MLDRWLLKQKENAVSKYRVWWIPQIPGKPFTVTVDSITQGRWLCDVLADYDLFQYENKIKPDYANAGGVQERDDDGWFDVEDADQDADA